MTILNKKHEALCTRTGKLDQLKLLQPYIEKKKLSSLQTCGLQKIENGVCIYLCMAWIYAEISPVQRRPAFSPRPKELGGERNKWSKDQSELIGAAASWYMGMPSKDIVRQFYQSAAQEFGMTLVGDSREYTGDHAVENTLQREAVIRLPNFQHREGVIVGIPCTTASGTGSGGHAVAASVHKREEGEIVHFFDPNFGEFELLLGHETDFINNYVENVLKGHLKWKLGDKTFAFDVGLASG